MEKTHIVHPIPPTYDGNSKVLVLGSFPSVKSREAMYFYGHPQNRFWPMMARIYGEERPLSTEEKRAFLLRHKIAAWDVIHSCDIAGSLDASITNVEVNDLSVILSAADLRAILVNGKTAYGYFKKYTRERIGRDALCMPSTSPANAAWSMEKLIGSWSVIRDYTG